MHDIYQIPRKAKHFQCRSLTWVTVFGSRTSIDKEKVVAVVETDAANRNAPFSRQMKSPKIAQELQVPWKLRSKRDVWNTISSSCSLVAVTCPNAVMAGLLDSKFENITYTEVIQDARPDRRQQDDRGLNYLVRFVPRICGENERTKADEAAHEKRRETR